VAVIEAEAQDHFGIKVSPAKRERLSEYLQVVGTVQPVNSRVAQIRPLARGRLVEVLAQVGDRVGAGQPLARFDNIEAGELAAQLASARAELSRVKVQVAAQATQAERNRRLADLGAAARKDYEQSRAEQQALEESVRAQESVVAGFAAKLERFGGAGAETVIRSPFAGVIIKAGAAPGEVAGPETELFTLADLSGVWVQAEVYEKDLAQLRIGQQAIITVDTYPERPFQGRVTYISDILDPHTRTAKVRCEVANPGALLKLDMFATVQLPTTFQREVIAVPSDAVQQVEGKNVVFVRKAPTRFEAREVGLGKVVNGRREIVSGLAEGEPVVTDGSFHLKSVLAGKNLGEE
jgi:cobalt-zinc-cadmium efflux system membrane fusion protein